MRNAVAAALYPHLKAGTPEPVQQRRQPNSVAEAMFPSLSGEAKAKEASQAWVREWVRAEQKAHTKRMVESLRQINERLRQEREG
jgi:hypothetical protein